MARNDQDLDLRSTEVDVGTSDENMSEDAPEIYRGVGDDLRRERERVGWSIVDVSQKLKIRRAYIAAIETGDAAAMPGHSYALGFVRSYAELMGADGELCVEYYKQETSGQAQPLDLHFPVPSQESRRPGIGALILCVVLAAGAYGVYYYYQNTGRTNVVLVPDVPDEISSQVSKGVASPTALPNVPADPRGAGKQNAKTAGGAGPDAEIPGVASVSIAAMTSSEAHAAVPDDGQTGGVNASLPQVGQVPRRDAVAPADPVRSAIAPSNRDAGDAGNDGRTGGPSAARVTAAPVPLNRPEAISPRADAGAEGADVKQAPLKVASLPPPPLPSVERPDRQPRAFGASDTARIIVRVSKPTRVIVSRVDGRRMLDRRLIVGDSYAVPDQPGLVLQADDISALTLRLDGQQLALPVSVGKAEFPLETSWLAKYR